jgi:phosphoglycerol transferase
MSGDEYAYFAAAQSFPDTTERFLLDPYLPRVYCPVFAAYGRLAMAISDRPELLVKFLNTLVFAITTLIVLHLLRRVAGSRPPATAAVVFALVPFSAYSAYFMPETVYGLFFVLLATCVVLFLPARPFVGAIACGSIVGVMLLVKPHAIALFAAVLLTIGALAVAPRTMRTRGPVVLCAVGLFTASTYAALVTVNWLLTAVLRLHPFLFVGEIYQSYLFQGLSVGLWMERLQLLLSILGGHVIVLASLVAPALALAITHLRGLYRGDPDRTERAVQAARAQFVLITFALLATLTAVAMTTNFTASAAQTSPFEALRIHGRYYSFVLWLHLLVFYGLMDQHRGRWEASWVRAGSVIGLAAACLLWYVRRSRVIFPFDYPEAFAFSAWHSSMPADGLSSVGAQVAIGVAIAAYAVMLWRGAGGVRAYSFALIAVFSVSSLRVTDWQRVNSVENSRLRSDARFTRRMVDANAPGPGLVVGPEWNGPIAYFLFNFHSSPAVLVRPRGAVVATSDVPPDARWVILIGEYKHALGVPPWVQTPRVTVFRLDGRSAASRLDPPARLPVAASPTPHHGS